MKTISVFNKNNEKISLIKQNNLNEERIFYFDLLRILSSYAVVLIHTSSKYYYKSKINTYILYLTINY